MVSVSYSQHNTDTLLTIANKELTKCKANKKQYVINNYLKPLGIKKYVNWCAAYVAYCCDKAGIKLQRRSAVAQHYITSRSIKAEYVLAGIYKIPKGSLVIWKYGNTWKGHIGITISEWKGKTGTTIEGNTSSNDTRQGGNWERKTRSISLGSNFRITHFTLVTE